MMYLSAALFCEEGAKHIFFLFFISNGIKSYDIFS